MILKYKDTDNDKIIIRNNSSSDRAAFISDTDGKLIRQLEVKSSNEKVVENITRGTCIVCP